MDPVGALVSGLGLLFVSVMLHVVTTQASNGTLDRNSAIGIRTRATQSSDAAWLAGHRAAGPWIKATAFTGSIAAGVGIVLSVVLLATKQESPVGLVVVLIGYVALITMLIISTAKANTAARAVADS